jgi:hypothetical protein
VALPTWAVVGKVSTWAAGLVVDAVVVVDVVGVDVVEVGVVAVHAE